MTRPIVGPSNAGKSTYIDRHGRVPTTYAYQLADGDVLSEGIIHYNLLHHALKMR